jgi:hypothetical protein
MTREILESSERRIYGVPMEGKESYRSFEGRPWYTLKDLRGTLFLQLAARVCDSSTSPCDKTILTRKSTNIKARRPVRGSQSQRL